MKIRPLGNRVLVKRDATKEEIRGGIIIPQAVVDKSTFGDVVAVGPGRVTDDGNLIPMAVSAGDRVLFGKWSGTEVDVDGVALLVMGEDDIQGVVTD